MDCQAIPKIPIPQPLAHPALQHRIRIRPPAHNPSQRFHTTRQTVAFPSLCTANTTASIHHAAEQVFWVQHLAHLLPHGQQISLQGVPNALIDGVGRRAAILAGDGGVEVALRVVGRAVVLGGLAGGDVASEGCAVGGGLIDWVVEVVEGGFNTTSAAAHMGVEFAELTIIRINQVVFDGCVVVLIGVR